MAKTTDAGRAGLAPSRESWRCIVCGEQVPHGDYCRWCGYERGPERGPEPTSAADGPAADAEGAASGSDAQDALRALSGHVQRWVAREIEHARR